MSTNANKIKQYIALRDMNYNELKEIKVKAELAHKDENYHLSFKVAFKRFDSIYDEFKKNHSYLVACYAIQEGADLESLELIRSTFENDCSIIQEIHCKIFGDLSDIKIDPSIQRNIKLPKIEVPKFSGDYKKFKTFIDLFNSLVHTNTALSDIEKFTHLCSSLEGSPLTLVQCTPMTGDNYIIAYNALNGRYHNKYLIATAYIQELENAPKLLDNNVNSQNLRRLLDTFNENLASLENMKFPTAEWDFLLFRMLLTRLDSNTRARFELDQNSDKSNYFPTFDSLKKFILKQCNAFDAVDIACPQTKFKKSNVNSNQITRNSFNNSNLKPRTSSSFLADTNQLICNLCKAAHSIYNCPIFNNKSPRDRFTLVKTQNWCVNCLGTKHTAKNCASKSFCRTCRQRHHTLLHFTDNISSPIVHPPLEPPNVTEPRTNTDILVVPSTSQTVNSFTGVVPNKRGVLLSTALVEILDAHNNYQKIRVLLDCGSQVNFISQKCLNRLGLSRYNLPLSVHGVGQMQMTSSSGGVTCTIRPVGKLTPSFIIDAVVLPKICNEMPTQNISINSNSHLANLHLADPFFGTPGNIDLLLGADIFPQILQSGRLHGNINEPSALHTIFGWVLMGPVKYCKPDLHSFFCTSDNLSLENTLKKFWEIEEVPSVSSLSIEDNLCEKLFSENYQRSETGRYIVSLPFREPTHSFGDSRSLALRRFLSLERRLINNPTLKNLYSEFMQDYINSEHMVITNAPGDTNNTYYIPHHCILKPDSTTTKLRVVFDASAKAPGCISLNDSLLIGPKLQKNIITILLNFRTHSHVFVADIKQMYRQILIKQDHRNFQRILWRFSPHDPIQDYKLNTVTYGVSSSPFLALRTLLQLSQDETQNFPRAAEILATDTYVDDIITGANTYEQALSLQKELILLLKSGGFELRKWASNDPRLLSHLPSSDLYNANFQFDLASESPLKILGLQWHPSNDSFIFSVTSMDTTCTKRNILSNIARIFDPLGILSPVTFYVKYLIQQLWSLGLDWDQSPPNNIQQIWSKYISEITYLSEFNLPRRVITENYKICEVHGFCDASERGYCSVVYFRLINSDGNISTRFVCAKSKVSPLKRISIPRLELCAAVLLANLMSFICDTYQDKLNFSKLFAWSDSTVALSWITSSPHKWKTFVSNRVSHIQQTLSPTVWHHVPSSDNPADCGSRGLLPQELLNYPLWWTGPAFLLSPQPNWSPFSSLSSSSSLSEVAAEEKKIVLTTLINLDSLDSLLHKYSSLPKIKRIIAYVLRFIQNLKSSRNVRQFNDLTNSELHRALLLLVKRVQHTSFSEDITRLENGRSLSKYLRKLSPFLDQEGVLRVGGRLRYSQLTYDQKHPALLPRCSRLTDLIIEDIHNAHFHPGVQTMHFLIAQNFWILSPRRAIHKVLSKCLKCWRLKPVVFQPPMGNLPPSRISQIKSFSETGIDYCGPFKIKLNKGRGAKTIKCYICLFVCFATKAIHLELASDLSTESFLAALRRFIARRGRCSHLYSDCGTNFVGAEKYLRQLFENAAKEEGIQWHFNPPSAPHFGGLWEAGVKSVKTHLSRVIGEQILTYEELYTVIVQIESLLNSRPLSPVSSDPSDLSVLTPGHFLTLEPLTALPEKDLTNVKLNLLTRWQLIQRLHQDFWSRWHKEYLHTLNQRGKWTNPSTPVEPGTMVLIKNELTPPMRWHLGRIIETHPGKDGVSRVATVKTQQGIFKRPLVKLCPLPTYNSV